MFFTKKNKQPDIGEVLSTLANLIVTSCTFSTKHYDTATRIHILNELDRLKSDHWDKDAFDRLSAKIKEL